MKLIFLPDISFHNSKLEKKSFKNFELFLAKLNINFSNAKIITNLESILLEKKIKPKNLNINNLHAHSNFSDVLNKYNIKNVSLSNNHTFDFNLSGYLQTKKILKSRGINHFGAGKNLLEAKKPLVFKNFNDKCAIFGASYKATASKTKAGVLNLKDEKTCQIIKSFKKKNKKTFLIIYCHSGLELFEFPLFQDELIYRKFIESGADLVIGSHPHRVQGIEKYQKKYIFYSIGDLFCENTSKKDWSRYTKYPAHGSIYKNRLEQNLLFLSYILEIDTVSKKVKVHEVKRDKNFNYKLKKFDQKKINKLIFNYRIKVNKTNISKYRTYIESKIFNNEY